MSKAKLVIIKSWNINLAEFDYRLVKTTNINGFYQEVLGEGDFEWAKKTAAHFNLQMPEEETQDE